jgi:hypothetical protein
MLLNLAWATGEMMGAPAAATTSEATTDMVPMLLLSAIMVITLVPVLRAGLSKPWRRPAPTQPSVTVTRA